ATACGATLFAPYSVARMERGAGRVAVERITYVNDQALARLAGFPQMILVGAPQPVAFFAYHDKPSLVTPPVCECSRLAEPHHNLAAALADWTNAIFSPHTAPLMRERV